VNLQQLHFEDCKPEPARVQPPDEKQSCLEDYFLSSARVPALLPACPAAWDAERFNDAQGGEAVLSDELAHAAVHWSTPTALDEPGFVSAWEDSEYVDGDQQDIGESLYGVPFDDACSRAQDSGECFDGDVDVDFDVESDVVKPSFDRPNLLSFETSEFMRRSNEEFWARHGKAPFNEPAYHLQAAERARWQVGRCDDPAYAAERLHSYLHPPLYVADEFNCGAPFSAATAAEPASFYVPHASDASAAVDERGCEWSAGDLHADYDECGAYYDPQYSAGWQAYDDVENDAGETCFEDGQWERDLPALDENAETEWHAEPGYYEHAVADGSYLAGDPILDGSCATSWYGGDVPEHDGAPWQAAGSAGDDHYAGAEYDAGQPHAHADSYGHGVHSDVQLGTYDEGNSGTYGHVHDPACEPSAAYYDPGGYGDNSYGADDYSTVGNYDGGTDYGYNGDGYSGGYNDGGYDGGDYGDDY